MARLGPHAPIFNPKTRKGKRSKAGQVGVFYPTVTINKASTQDDPTRWPIFAFEIEFDQDVTGLVAADITASSSLGLTLVKRLTALSGSSYLLEVKYAIGGASSLLHNATAGTITATIPAGVCTSIATGLLNVASTSTDNVVSFEADFVQASANILTLTSRSYRDAAKIADHLFITEYNGGRLLSVDVSTPASPSVTQTLTPITGGSSNATNPSGLAADGTQVFITSTWQARVMNVSNPAAMTTTGTTSTDGTNLNRGETCIYGDDHIYVGNIVTDRFTVVDVNPAATPAVVGSLTDATFLLNPSVHVKVGDYVFLLSTNTSSSSYLVAVDVSTPSSPSIADTITIPSTNGIGGRSSLIAIGDHLVCAAGGQDLYTIDASDPTNLAIAATTAIPISAGNFSQNFTPTGVAEWDTDVVLARGNFNTMMLIDVSDMTDPQPISATPYMHASTVFTQIIVDSNHVFQVHANAGLHVAEYVGP